jgi:hypothetical protein
MPESERKLKHVRSYERGKGTGRYSHQVLVWIEETRLEDVDMCLDYLKSLYPADSISKIVCDAIITHTVKIASENEAK